MVCQITWLVVVIESLSSAFFFVSGKLESFVLGVENFLEFGACRCRCRTPGISGTAMRGAVLGAALIERFYTRVTLVLSTYRGTYTYASLWSSTTSTTSTALVIVGCHCTVLWSTKNPKSNSRSSKATKS